MHLVAHYDRDFRRLFEPDIVMEDGRRFPERPPVEEWFECGRRSLNLWQQYYANMNERWEMQVTHHWASAVALAAAEACRVTAGQSGSSSSLVSEIPVHQDIAKVLRTVPCGTLVTSLKMINELNLTRDAVPDIELDEAKDVAAQLALVEAATSLLAKVEAMRQAVTKKLLPPGHANRDNPYMTFRDTRAAIAHRMAE